MSLIRTYGSPSIHPGSRQGRVFPDLGRETEACVLSHFSQVQLLAALWTAILQAPLSMGFSRQEYCSGLPWPPPGDLPNPGIKPASFMSSCIGREFFTTRDTEAEPGSLWNGCVWAGPARWGAGRCVGGASPLAGGAGGRSLRRRSSGGEDSTVRTHPLYSFIFRGGQVPPSTGLTCTPTL